MAVNPANNYTKLRLMGLSSGMETDTIIKQMMQISQRRIDVRFRAMKKFEWKQESLKNVSNQLTDFRWKYLTVMGADAMRNSSVYNSTVASITSKNPDNAGAISISTNINATTGTLVIGQVESLATANSVSSSVSASRSGNGFNMTDKIGDLLTTNWNISFNANGNAKVNINRTEVTLNLGEINTVLTTGMVIDGDVKNAAGAVIGKEHQFVLGMDGNPIGPVGSDGEIVEGGTDKITDIISYINYKIFQAGQAGQAGAGQQIRMQSGYYENGVLRDEKYASMTINGKTTIVYERDLVYNFGEITSNNSNLGSSLNFYGAVNFGAGIGSVDISQSDISDHQDSTAGVSGIIGLIRNIYESRGLVFDPENVEINGVSISVKNNDSLATVNRKIQEEASSAGLSGDRSIKLDYADIYEIDGVSYSSTPVTIHRNDTLAEVNEKLKTAFSLTEDVFKIGEAVNINGFARDVTLTNSNVNKSINAPGTSNIVSKFNAIPSGMTFDTNGRAYVTLNSRTIEISRNMTVEEMLDTINSSGAGVTMTYDRMSDSFKIESNQVGKTTMQVGGLQAFGIMNGSYEGGSLARVQVKIGDDFEWRESRTNTWEIRPGVTITLNETTKPIYDEDGKLIDDNLITVAFRRDATESLEKIRGFVEGFNSLIKKLEDMTKESKTAKERAYGPLTEEEKSAMTDKQIEEWEAIAKKGLLWNDPGLQNIISTMRNSLYDKVKGAGLSPAEIGLKTGSYLEGNAGQIILDETRLKEALERDPVKVMEVFMGGADSKVYDDRGLLWRVEDALLGYMNGSQAVSLSSLETSIKRENDQIEKLTQKMWEEEEKLYLKFAAMETALAKLQEQSDWFMSMLGQNK